MERSCPVHGSSGYLLYLCGLLLEVHGGSLGLMLLGPISVLFLLQQHSSGAASGNVLCIYLFTEPNID